MIKSIQKIFENEWIWPMYWYRNLAVLVRRVIRVYPLYASTGYRKHIFTLRLDYQSKTPKIACLRSEIAFWDVQNGSIFKIIRYSECTASVRIFRICVHKFVSLSAFFSLFYFCFWFLSVKALFWKKNRTNVHGNKGERLKESGKLAA